MPPEVRFFLICVALLGLALLGLAYLRDVAWWQRRARRRQLRRANGPTSTRHSRLPARRRSAPAARSAASQDDATVAQMAREAITIAERYRRDWQATVAQLEVARAELAAAQRQPDPPETSWLDDLLGAIHLLIIGHTRAGKTTLVHTLATRHAAAGRRVLVCDLDAAPGLWSGCLVFGFQNNVAAVEAVLQAVAKEVQARRSRRGSGAQRRFAPLYVVIDEYQDVLRACPAAKPLVEDVLQRGGKLDVQLIIGVPDMQVQTLGFEGRSALRKHFTYVVELRKDPQGQRWAEVLPTGSTEATVYAVPPLADLERLIRVRGQQRSARPDPLLSMLFRASAGQDDRGVAENQRPGTSTALQNTMKSFAGDFSDEKTVFSALGGSFALPFDAVELARIAEEIRAGKTQTEVVRGMVGYHTTKHRVFVGYYQTIANALQQHRPSTARDDLTA